MEEVTPSKTGFEAKTRETGWGDRGASGRCCRSLIPAPLTTGR